ncbi:MAG: hypothetical protein GY820_18880, partial [Gammaproteobacteria bacterium]|nr:hypothetical protein [Gammaproteobacteria bacterium]
IEVREALEAKYEYAYDDADRLTTVDTTLTGETTTANQSYGYDPVSNRDSYNQASWVYDDNDRLQQRGDISYEYDGNGSRTKQTDSGVITNYVYNLENRLSEIRDGNNSLIASYRYDPFGKRISKTVSGNTTYYYYSEDGLVAEADGIGAVTTSYHYQLNAPWGTDPMFIRQGGVYGYYITDHLGTPQRVVGSNGAVLWGAVYDAFGEAGIVTASLVNNLRFPGQYFDLESGLHYNYFRYYDPTTGRYITSDPIGLVGGLNTYAYVGGNPVNFIDFLGLAKSCSYYDTRCNEDGGTYYCELAPAVCNNYPDFPTEDWATCVRDCLQLSDYQCDDTPNQCGGGTNTECQVDIHQMCWLSCGL